MEGILSKRQTTEIDYNELSDEETERNGVVDFIINEAIETATGPNNKELNKKKQLKKVIKKGDNEDWAIVTSKTLPKGRKAMEDCYSFYISFHPGVFKTLCPMIGNFLGERCGITLKSGRPDKFGEAVIKNITYFDFKADRKEKILLIN